MEIKLKQLIKICNNNLKGCIKNESLDKYLPIKDDKIEIYLKDRILYIKSDKKIKKIYEQDGYFLNLEIMKEIGNLFAINLKSNKLLDLIKFKNTFEIFLG